MSHHRSSKETTSPLPELAGRFLRLGVSAFGGPAAHIALFEEEFVVRRQWLSRDHFLDLLGATHLVPGPNSTEMAIHIGYVRAGVAGAVTAGACFIGPAFALVLAIAVAYVEYGSLPAAERVLTGVQPVILVVILGAGWRLGKRAVDDVVVATVAAAVLGLALATQIGTLWLLLGAGGAAVAARRALTAAIALPLTMGGLTATTEASPSLEAIFAVFLKIGAVLYGSGYVLIAYLEREVVAGRSWLTGGQLLDAVAAGQMTPGPVLTTAAFIGYLLRGPTGAVVATLGIFLPSFLIVLAMGPFIDRLRNQPLISDFLDGVNAAVVALIAAVVIDLGQQVLTTPLTVALAALALVLHLRLNVSGLWLVILGASAGLIAALV